MNKSSAPTDVLPNGELSEKLNEFDLVRKYYTLIHNGDIEENAEQDRVVNELQAVGEDILTHVDLLKRYRKNLKENDGAKAPPKTQTKQATSSFWGLFGSEEVTPVEEKPTSKVIKHLPAEYAKLKDMRGVYLHGGPGTGKTFLMDLFYNELPIKNKQRLHYAEFMLQIHQMEHKINQQKDRAVDTITKVGNDYSKGIDILCIDEFQVLHISDAMILKRLFEAFFDNYMICFITSNRPPSDLYLNGLQRFLFMPFIDMVNSEMNVVTLQGVDYRTRDYVHGEDKKRRRHMIWNDCTGGAEGDIVTVKVAQGRSLTIPKFHEGVAMMSFYDLCGKALGNSDYMALCENIHTLILTDVPHLSLDRRDYLRRFIWLIDALYDKKIRLYISTQVDVRDIYQDKGAASR